MASTIQPTAGGTGRRTFSPSVRRTTPRDTHGSANRPRIAIIGGGFSGTLVGLHLLRRCPDARILLIERNRQFGLGLAYAHGNPSHLLNVPAGKMSAFHDRPNDFLNWLDEQGETDHEGKPVDKGSFVPRRTFGAYIRHLLNTEFKSGDANRLELLRGEVLRIEEKDNLVLTLDRDRQTHAHLAIVAVGNFPPEPPPVADPWFYESERYRGDPWGYDTLTDLDPQAPVLLIGTGLTMVDTLMSLLDQGHTGPIHALSRRGLVPRRHTANHDAAQLAPHALPGSVSGLVRLIRREIIEERAQGVSWQAVIDALRPVTQGVWLSLSESERARFLRHVRPWWDVHRHRLAPAIAARLDGARRSGQLTVTAGRIQRYSATESAVDVHYRCKSEGQPDTIRAERVINCSGPACDFQRIKNPLVESLLADGRVRPDSLRLGLDVTQQGALRSRDGAVSQRLYAIGPLTKGLFWEVTSVPDIRRQCELLATHLAQVVATQRFRGLPDGE
jgi:uncharacterized NAD(P)/FAD-binding protein YdhS